jgi:hypothetical protein
MSLIKMHRLCKIVLHLTEPKIEDKMMSEQLSEI